MTTRLEQERAEFFGINQIHPRVTDTKSHSSTQQQHTTQLVVVMEGPTAATWKAELCEEQIVALRPEDICHKRQLALPLRWGGAGWASKASAEVAVGQTRPRQAGVT